MEISEVRKRLLQTVERAKLQAADRRAGCSVGRRRLGVSVESARRVRRALIARLKGFALHRARPTMEREGFSRALAARASRQPLDERRVDAVTLERREEARAIGRS